MIDLISHEEPAIHELDQSPSLGSGVPYLAWFLTALVLQVVVIIGLAANKTLATVSGETTVKLRASAYVHHDKFRGNYINGLTVRADEYLPAPLKSKRIRQSLNASINTPPFFVSEKLANHITLMSDSRKPIEFELRVSDSGQTRIVSVEN